MWENCQSNPLFQNEDNHHGKDQLARKRSSDRRNSIVTLSLEFPGEQKRARGKTVVEAILEADNMVGLDNTQLSHGGVNSTMAVGNIVPIPGSTINGNSEQPAELRRVSLSEVQTQLLLELERNNVTIRNLLTSQTRDEEVEHLVTNVVTVGSPSRTTQKVELHGKQLPILSLACRETETVEAAAIAAQRAKDKDKKRQKDVAEAENAGTKPQMKQGIPQPSNLDKNQLADPNIFEVLTKLMEVDSTGNPAADEEIRSTEETSSSLDLNATPREADREGSANTPQGSKRIIEASVTTKGARERRSSKDGGEKDKKLKAVESQEKVTADSEWKKRSKLFVVRTKREGELHLWMVNCG
ncbi:hypothetical protein R1sor_024166 [Riccia sorocarpa]|uniref:Uncharacterized protein n=1 Tax=Riccia sorocarpa TaxID=122646 RepID=A0ABD3GPQ1_9MARC